MPEALSHVVEDNTETILKEFFGADEATATVEEESEDPKQFMMEVTYEGELERTEETYFAQVEEDQPIQYVKVLNVLNEYFALASYTFRSETELQELAEEIIVLEE